MFIIILTMYYTFDDLDNSLEFGPDGTYFSRHHDTWDGVSEPTPVYLLPAGPPYARRRWRSPEEIFS